MFFTQTRWDSKDHVPNVGHAPPEILPVPLKSCHEKILREETPRWKKKHDIFPFHVGARSTELFCEAVLVADQKRGFIQFALRRRREVKNHCTFFFQFILFSRAPPHSYVMSKHKIFDAVIHSITGTNNNICIFRPRCNSYNIRKKSSL